MPRRYPPSCFSTILQVVCLWGTRSDGGVRLTWPKKAVKSDSAYQLTPLRQWLGEWLPSAPRTAEGLPLLTLWLEGGSLIGNDWYASCSTLLVKRYRPREGKVEF